MKFIYILEVADFFTTTRRAFTSVNKAISAEFAARRENPRVNHGYINCGPVLVVPIDDPDGGAISYRDNGADNDEDRESITLWKLPIEK